MDIVKPVNFEGLFVFATATSRFLLTASRLLIATVHSSSLLVSIRSVLSLHACLRTTSSLLYSLATGTVQPNVSPHVALSVASRLNCE